MERVQMKVFGGTELGLLYNLQIIEHFHAVIADHSQ